MAGEVKSDTYLDVQKIARDVINRIGYTKGDYMFDGKSCGVLSAIHEQSPDINQGVDRTALRAGSGDQGMMFWVCHQRIRQLYAFGFGPFSQAFERIGLIEKENKDITYLRPDAKAQVTI
ncbi:S-adenosylmethionine synthetase N-terminal domain-containing protein [Echinicola jeungdonensis]|uniref:S-adenosylmethionine synthetase N-terminal domain-containing protein n=1 Tax=Echinicola jeungdonensis TaxID=709343 RepID=UPI003F492D47